LSSSTPSPSRPRILALDVGKKRIGLAISDELGLTAQGLDTYYRTRIREDLATLATLARTRGVTLLLVGRPVHMSGAISRQAVYTEEFAQRLQERTHLPVQFWDERLTSVEAERVLRDGGATLEQKKLAVDRMSAVLLLESYLENRRILAEEETLEAEVDSDTAGEPFLG
jgi:putative Holliday junction resolvase